MRSFPLPAPLASARLFTVGHSNHDWPRFLELLQGAGITAVADVRSYPVSRRLPQFNREPLERGLREHDILYVLLGSMLGGLMLSLGRGMTAIFALVAVPAFVAGGAMLAMGRVRASGLRPRLQPQG